MSEISCPIRERTGDGTPVGRCWFPTTGGQCERHGDVSAYLARLPKLTDENDMLRDRGLPTLGPSVDPDPTADAASLLFWSDQAENAKTSGQRERASCMVDVHADRLVGDWARRLAMDRAAPAERDGAHRKGGGR